VSRPFDAVLVIAFGAPAGLADVRPFLANVLRGRRVSPQRIEEVVRHYEHFNGVSPLTELTLRQAEGLRDRLRDTAFALPVYVGMRNWHPYLADALEAMSRAGVRRAVGFIAAAHRSYSSCAQYRDNVLEARRELARRGLRDVEITYVGNWHTHPGFIAANAAHARDALEQLPSSVRDRTRLIFTAHSIPVPMAERYPYRRQFEETARAVAAHLGSSDFATVYQSRSGRPEDPWLEPDITDYLRASRQQGLAAAVLCPVGFVADHVEVLYDLDVEAAGVCREIGLAMTRARTVNDHPRFLDMMADVVLQTIRPYHQGLPLTLVDETRICADERG
jgi:protoporphyrin/coproporphyrin ferrochelatase